MSALTWHSLGWKNEALADGTSRIVGTVSGGYRDWIAVADGRNLGAYVNEAAAKRAVEKALAA